MKNKSLENRLDEILWQRKLLRDTMELLIKEHRSIVAEGRSIRKALHQGIMEPGSGGFKDAKEIQK
jgi:hypothetical protein